MFLLSGESILMTLNSSNSTIIGRTAVKPDAHIDIPLRMSCNNFGDPLAFLSTTII